MQDINQYTPEFKRRVLDLVKEGGKFIVRVAKELDLNPNTLYNWQQLALNTASA